MDYNKLMVNIAMDDVFNAAALKSSAVASHVRDNFGIAQDQYIALTEYDKDLWELNLRESADKVYNYLMQAGKIKQGTYRYNVTPVARNDGAGVITATATTIQAGANDDLSGTSKTFALVGSMGGAQHASSVTIDPDTGEVVYTSVSAYVGTDRVNYKITSDGLEYFATIFINVAAEALMPAFPESSNLITYTLYLHWDWDVNLAQGLSNLIHKALVSGGLYEWFKSIAQYELAKVYQQEYTETLASAKSNINRRIHTVRRPHVTF